mmetsp:Transcript_32106/g.65397  ORF Transcript_32106/g.65397 Transcript_32106/m.65397 type:complete len:214 (+) Transcript_32106:220-861(+)
MMIARYTSKGITTPRSQNMRNWFRGLIMFTPDSFNRIGGLDKSSPSSPFTSIMCSSKSSSLESSRMEYVDRIKLVFLWGKVAATRLSFCAAVDIDNKAADSDPGIGAVDSKNSAGTQSRPSTCRVAPDFKSEFFRMPSKGAEVALPPHCASGSIFRNAIIASSLLSRMLSCADIFSSLLSIEPRRSIVDNGDGGCNGDRTIFLIVEPRARVGD